MNLLRMPDAHSIHESGRIIRRAGAMKNRWMRQIIIAESVVRQIVAGQFHAAGSRPRADLNEAENPETTFARAPMDVRTTTASSCDAVVVREVPRFSRAPMP
ncbi:hypothetical protein F3J14_08695 [Burkholderia sp. Tr-862]|nr:hypothetical protein [Burkholderia sp. Tr-862]